MAWGTGLPFRTRSFSFFARTLLALLPFTAAVVIFYSVLIHIAAMLTEDHLAQQYLAQEMARFEQQGQTRLPSTSYLDTFGQDDPGLPRRYRDLAPGAYEFDRNFHVKVSDVKLSGSVPSVRRLVMVLDESKFSAMEEWRLLRSILWPAAGLVMIAGSILVVVLARRISAPVVVLAEQVSRGWQPGIRFAGGERHDEIGHLSRSLDALVTRLHAAIERETAFTRHVSHELRTPLTVVRNALSVAMLPTCSGEKRARNLARIDRACGEIEVMVETFLHLGREKNDAGEVVVEIRPLIEKCLEKFTHLHHGSIQIGVESDAGASANGHPALIEVVLGNIIQNALVHGTGGISIVLRDGEVEVRNPFEITEIPSPAAGSPGHGHGHGLDIVRRVCDHAGWNFGTRRSAGTFAARVVFSRRTKGPQPS